MTPLRFAARNWHIPAGYITVVALYRYDDWRFAPCIAAFAAAGWHRRHATVHDFHLLRWQRWLDKRFKTAQRGQIKPDGRYPVPTPHVTGYDITPREVLQLDIALDAGTDPEDFDQLIPTLEVVTKAKILTLGHRRLTFVWRDRLIEPVPFRLPAQPRLEALEVGIDVFGRPLHLDLTAVHAKIAGATRQGKTALLNAIIAQLVAAGIDVWVFDGKEGADIGPWEPIVARYRDRPDNMHAAMLELETERRHRAEGSKAFPGLKLRPIVVIVDEQASIKANVPDKNAFERALNDLIRKGLSSRISLILSTQNPQAEVMTTELKGNILATFGFRCGHNKQSEAIFPVDVARLVQPDWPPGRGVFEDNVEAHHLRTCGLFGDQLHTVIAELQARRQPAAGRSVAVAPVLAAWPAPTVEGGFQAAPARWPHDAVGVPFWPPPVQPIPLPPAFQSLLPTEQLILVELTNAVPNGVPMEHLTAITGKTDEACRKHMRSKSIGKYSHRHRLWFLASHAPDGAR